MAIITYHHGELCRFAGKKLSMKELRENLDMIGAPVDSIEGEEIHCDITPNRIDLLSVEGMGRALSNFMGIRAPWDYGVSESGISLKTDVSVRDIRPYVVAGVVTGIVVDDSLIRSIMQVQEKIHTTYGRNRKKVAIGLHNLDPLKPPFSYKAVHPNEISFVPLGMDESLNLEQILKRHPKGQDYAHLLKDKHMYPIIVDSNNNVLSFPPIINGELTRVSEDTTNLFIDVTGTSFDAINDTLNVMSALFADRGGKLCSVDVDGKALPDMGRREVDVSVGDINGLIGFNLTSKKTESLLARMGHISKGGVVLRVRVPPYRVDVMHWVDIAEDVAIAYGYNRLEPTLPQLPTIGKLIENKEESIFRNTSTGLGFNEVLTYTLSNTELNYTRMLLKDDGKASKIMNPITSDFTLFRTWVLPSLLNVLASNSHEAMPQKLSETGDCIIGGKRQLHAACVVEKAKATFSEIKSFTEAFVFEAGWECEFKEEDHPSFIQGRCLSVYVGRKLKGYFGEIHPQILNNFGIEEPVIALEIQL
ncbi:MAG: phenylalanine--tRNA ligase subunit beta [Candidatus Micrarchaeota archaeon]